MFTHKDIEYKTIFVINAYEGKTLRIRQGELFLQDLQGEKTYTKLPFQKILALFIVGNISITTPLIESCTRYGIPIVVTRHNFRPVFFFSITAEANFLLRKKQYRHDPNDLQICEKANNMCIFGGEKNSSYQLKRIAILSMF